MNELFVIKAYIFDQLAALAVANAQLSQTLQQRDQRIAELEAQAAKPVDHEATP